MAIHGGDSRCGAIGGGALMQYLGGKADVGKRIAEACGKRRTPGALFVDICKRIEEALK